MLQAPLNSNSEQLAEEEEEREREGNFAHLYKLFLTFNPGDEKRKSSNLEK